MGDLPVNSRNRLICCGSLTRLAPALAILCFQNPALAESDGVWLRTNQAILEDLARQSEFDLTDLLVMFDRVLATLPSEVTVFPTENYYYIQFRFGGLDYAGNIRLAANDRDSGIVHFAYFAAASLSGGEGEMFYKALSIADGVEVQKIDELAYRVTSNARSVVFRLNDLTSTTPPAGVLGQAEDYLGPIFDESGLQFYLVYNRDLKIFHYVLNETEPVLDWFRPAAFSDRIMIGHRTGFAFYADQQIGRKILIGVHAANSAVNNYYDGPFDQLPDNFIQGNALKDAIEASDPNIAGRIDRFGYFETGEGRYLIGPYLTYSAEVELSAFDLCATNQSIPPERYHACFAIQGGGFAGRD